MANETLHSVRQHFLHYALAPRVHRSWVVASDDGTSWNIQCSNERHCPAQEKIPCCSDDLPVEAVAGMTVVEVPLNDGTHALTVPPVHGTVGGGKTVAVVLLEDTEDRVLANEVGVL